MPKLRDIEWRPELVDVDDLIENEKNPKILNEQGRKRLRKSLAKFGLAGSIIANQDNTIIDGHSRKKELIDAGVRQVWVSKPSRPLTDEEYREMNAIFDIAKAGDPDMQIIEELFSDEFFDEWELDRERTKPKAKEDNFKIPDKIKTSIKPGDILEIGPHRLICGDSTKSHTWQKLLGGELADMVMTDPPYNVNYQGSTGMTIENDDMPDADFYAFLLAFYKAGEEHTKPGGAWYVWHADSEGANFRRAFKESGLLLKQCLVWVKNSLVMGRQDYHWKHEPCLYGWKAGAAHYFTDDRTKTTVIEDQLDIASMKKADMQKLLQEILSDKTRTTVLRADKPAKNDLHPTMKPILLLAPLIDNSSQTGEIVADPFGGSGSTMVTAHQMNRRCRMIELDPTYCQVIVERMRTLEPEISITKNGKRYG